MFTTYINTGCSPEWLEKYHCFDNNYLINSDESKVINNQFNGSGIYDNKFVSNRTDIQNESSNNLNRDEVEELQFDMRGSLTNYIVNHEKKEIYIIPDPLGLSIIFYYLSPNLKVFSNSINEIIKVLERFNITLTKNIDYLFESLVMGNGGLKHNPYKEILALEPFNFVSVKKNNIHTVTNSKIIDFIQTISSNENYEDVISVAKEDIQKNLKLASEYKNNGLKICQLTGGFDSRLILSSLLNQNLEQEFMYFCSGKDGTKDKDIAKNLCRHFHLTYTDYSGYVLNRPIESRIDSFLWSLDYTAGICYEAHGNYKKLDNLIISGGLGGLYRSVYGLGNENDSATTYYEILKKQWPMLDTNSSKSIFNKEYLYKFHQNFLDAVKSTMDLGIPEYSVLDFIYLRYRARYFVGQISFYMSSTNPRFDALYSLKGILMTLFQNQKVRSSNIIGLQLMDEFHSTIKLLPFDTNKFNNEYIEMVGVPEVIEFDTNHALKEFKNYNKPPIKNTKRIDKSLAEKHLQRANKMKATLWQVEDEQEARDGLKEVMKNIPSETINEVLNKTYLDKILYNQITNRVDLRRLHTLYRSFLWYY